MTLNTLCASVAVAQRADSASTAPSAARTAGPPLQPGDAVKLTIWREPDLSGTFTLDETGTAVFPKIGVVHADRMPTDSLKRFLVNSYTPFLRDPSIDVVVLRRIAVSGFVRTPGLYSVDPTVSVADVIALAGGAAPDGQADKVEIVRDGKPVVDALSRRTRIGDSPLRSGDQLYVPERSWLSRNPGAITGIVSAVVLATTTLIKR